MQEKISGMEISSNVKSNRIINIHIKAEIKENKNLSREHLRIRGHFAV